MTAAQLDKLVDWLAETYELSAQLTAAWLRENGYTARSIKLSSVNLTPNQIESLKTFAKAN